jgi:hypothetical protein
MVSCPHSYSCSKWPLGLPPRRVRPREEEGARHTQNATVTYSDDLCQSSASQQDLVAPRPPQCPNRHPKSHRRFIATTVPINSCRFLARDILGEDLSFHPLCSFVASSSSTNSLSSLQSLLFLFVRSNITYHVPLFHVSDSRFL